MRGIIAFIVAVLVVALLAPLAFAQAVVEQPAVSTSSWLSPVWQILQPIITVFVSIAGPALATWLAYRLISLLNISDENKKKAIEAQIRDALHQAAMNALKYAITARTGAPLGDMVSGIVPPDIINEAVKYVRSKNPDAAARVNDQNLIEIILSKVPDVQAILAAGQSRPAVTIPTNPIGG